MATPDGRQGRTLIERLFREPFRFEFFQAVRILEWMRRDGRRPGKGAGFSPVGFDGPPENEAVRFRSLPSIAFPPSEITDIRKPGARKGRGANQQPSEMTVTFMGLSGPSGALPDHYTETIISRGRVRDSSLHDFLDLFTHRAVSLFFRAWSKHHLPSAYERASLDGSGEDSFTPSLYSLRGLGTGHLHGRQLVEDQSLLFYAGHLSHFPRSAAGLESILADYFDVPVAVEEFRGEWLHFDRDQRTRIGGPGPRGESYNQLGSSVVIGERMWSVEGRFLLRLGPLSYDEFDSFLPSGRAMWELAEITRTYVGPELAYDLQLMLHGEAVPRCRLAAPEGLGARLGWNTWLCGGQPGRPADDVIIRLDADYLSCYHPRNGREAPAPIGPKTKWRSERVGSKPEVAGRQAR